MTAANSKPLRDRCHSAEQSKSEVLSFVFFTFNPFCNPKPFMKKGSRVVNYAQVPVVEHVRRKKLIQGWPPVFGCSSRLRARIKSVAPRSLFQSRVTTGFHRVDGPNIPSLGSCSCEKPSAMWRSVLVHRRLPFAGVGVECWFAANHADTAVHEKRGNR